MMANFAGETLFSGDMAALTKMLGGMKAKQRNAVIDFILDLFRYLKEKLSGNEKITLEIVKLERMFNEAVYDAAQSLKSETKTSQNEKTTTEINGNGDYSVNNSIKEQLKNNSDLLNSMDPVASVQEQGLFEYKQQALEWALKSLKNTGYKVNRKSFGEIIIDKKG